MANNEAIERLQEIRAGHAVEKARGRALITERNRERVRVEVAEFNLGLDKEFAVELMKAWESGVTQSQLRTEVLRTNAWDRWVYWRDLAGLPTRGE